MSSWKKITKFQINQKKFNVLVQVSTSRIDNAPAFRKTKI